MTAATAAFQIRPATDGDVPQIFRLLAFYALKQIVLPRTEADIRYYLANFTVAVNAETDELLGCMAVRDFGNRLFEVRSLVIKPEYQKLGIGRQLVQGAIKRLQAEHQEFKLFALTCQTDFFLRSGFVKVEKQMFPEKIWSDCMLCPKHEHCDEEAVLFEQNTAE